MQALILVILLAIMPATKGITLHYHHASSGTCAQKCFVLRWLGTGQILPVQQNTYIFACKRTNFFFMMVMVDKVLQDMFDAQI
jgi:hypothetical protein